MAVRNGANFVVAAVDNTRLADGVPTSRRLVELWRPHARRDTHRGSRHIHRSIRSAPQPWRRFADRRLDTCSRRPARRKGGSRDSRVRRENNGRCSRGRPRRYSLVSTRIGSLVTRNSKLYKVEVRAGQDVVEDLIGFRTIETRALRYF